ncbi:MAG TPA: cytochrome c [Bacillales bacterium]|nr:cytochrome c [Bacillales bacterium]
MKNPLIPFGVTMILGVVLMFIISFYGASQLGQPEAKSGTANAKPKEIFLSNCASCHGQNLEGGFGPPLAHIGGKLSKEQILEQIKKGGGKMPAGIIKGEAAEKVATWLSKKK